MKRFAHWVFDLDGTVLDSSRFYELTLKEILPEFGITPGKEEINRAYKYFNPDDYFATFGFDAAKIKYAVQRLVAKNMEYADQIPAYEGIENLLVYLIDRDVEVTAWTGRELLSATKILDSTGLRKHFKTCVGRTCVTKNKPHPDGLLKILSDFNRHSDDVVMIGDHEYDMRGAQAAKVTGISVNWEGRVKPHVQSLAAHHFDKVAELHRWATNIYG
ncbi:MAG: HAD family hydrolase [Bdellovibrionales bacterium]|nr:HAD family hydrolase [Bdellovibrionales bacterium]